MNNLSKLLNRLMGLSKAVVRYPITEVFLVMGAVLNAIAINGSKDYQKELLALLVGAFIGVCAQALYERFFDKTIIRIALMGASVALTFGYYLILLKAPVLSVEIIVRTTVALLALLFAYILIPAIKNTVNFNQSFLAVFKSFFQTILYSGVIFGGSSLIILAFDRLIAPVDYRAFSHVANVVFVLFSPLFFLSLIPVYPGKLNEHLDQEHIQAQQDAIQKTCVMPRFLEILISYIIIPLATVYTLILALYLVLNVRGNFWTNNLMEPMLVSYSIIVIIIYILACLIDNKFANLFRLVFPKVLVPLVVFQIVASVLKIGDFGITYTRYYVIIYGIFAAMAGLVMSFLPPVKNILIGAFLIALSLVSIVPPVDAFTISKKSQIDLLEKTLIDNGMLENNQIISKSDLDKDAKDVITKTVEYLSNMDYIDTVAFIPDGFDIWEDFHQTFGFEFYYYDYNPGNYLNISLGENTMIPTAGYDYFAAAGISKDKYENILPLTFTHEQAEYTVDLQTINNGDFLVLSDSQKQAVCQLDIGAIFTQLKSYDLADLTLTYEQATFTSEQNNVRLTLVLRGGYLEYSTSTMYYYLDGFILVDFA